MAKLEYPYKGITDMELELEDRARNKAGAGRGKQGGPTAKELADYERKQNRGIYTAEMGKPPTDPEMAKKRGGMIESKRTKKFAGGGAMGSAQDMGKSLTELTGSLGTISQGLSGGAGASPGLGGLMPGGVQPMPDYGDFQKPMVPSVGGLMNNLGLQKSFKKGGVVSASKRGDGIAQRGKTRGKMC